MNQDIIRTLFRSWNSNQAVANPCNYEASSLPGTSKRGESGHNQDIFPDVVISRRDRSEASGCPELR